MSLFEIQKGNISMPSNTLKSPHANQIVSGGSNEEFRVNRDLLSDYLEENKD